MIDVGYKILRYKNDESLGNPPELRGRRTFQCVKTIDFQGLFSIHSGT